MGVQPPRPVRPVADGVGLRALLRLRGGRDPSVRAGALPGHGARRTAGRPRLPPDRGPGPALHRLDPPAEVAHARQAVLRLSRAGGHPCPASRLARMGRALPGPLQPGLGPPAPRDLRAAEAPGRDPARGRAHRAAGGDPRLGRHARGAEADPGPPDGDLRRLPGACRPPRGPGGPGGRRARPARRHPRLLHHRRQRGLGRGTAQRLLQRAAHLQRDGGVRDARVPGVEDRGLRRPGRLQPLRRGLGPRHGHAVPVDQAGGLALGRDAQRARRALAREHPRLRRDARPVPPPDRRGAHRPGGGAPRPSRRSSTA